ncbi:hypothetical protein [Microbacterium sp. Leaf159]|uniref:hypothetical protein n=1 Tax=Microbacterium sp. Leaf159 TaxID=1736279 RepID=UPI0006F981AA|nr:hypothetical protein [Microbacterium sp. Leaf159]KQR39483.1 hypothetical protein ASF80_08760 [Microbacterium sp. Leaf159]
MFIAGIASAVIGIVLFHMALGRTLRANAGVRIPFGGRPREIPHGSIQMRAIAAGLIVLGGVLVSTEGWHWTLMVVAAGPVAAMIVLSLHNRRVRREARSAGA